MVDALSLPPLEPTRLLGRAVELETIEQRLVHEGARLLTLTGPAGVGKTRLALEASVQVADHFPDGVMLVDLTPIQDPRLVLPKIAQALDLTDAGPRPLLERLREYLQEQEMLLVLDNFEHVLPAAQEIAGLLPVAPALRMLVTSRGSLRLRWEQVMRVLPLPVPDPDSQLPLTDLMQIPSVALFVERARAQRVDFIPTEPQALLLAQLARQLDGLPLALELAAANINILPLAVIARRLNQHVQTLHWNALDLPPRQRSLQAAIGWSYDLLPPSEQRLFRYLGVFMGQVTLDAIEAVVGDGDEEGTLEGMMSLAERSLVLPRQPHDDDPEPSFGMLETVRQYAAELLDKHEDLDTANRNHALYFLALAERADLELQRPGQLTWFSRLKTEHDNVRAALRWLLDHDEHTYALRLAGALGNFWWRAGHHSEGLRALEETLEKAPQADPVIRTKALLRAGWTRVVAGDFERSHALLEEGRMLAQQSHDQTSIAQSLIWLGAQAMYSGQMTESRPLLLEGLKQAEKLQDDYQIASALIFLAGVTLLEQDYAETIALAAASASRFKTVGDLISATIVQFYLALALQHEGDTVRAVQLVREGLLASTSLQNRWQLGLAVEATVLLVGETADRESLARLVGAGDALVQSTGALPGTLTHLSRQSAVYDREHLEREGLGALYHAGRSLSFAHAVDMALALLEAFSQSLDVTGVESSEVPRDNPLSSREVEVLRLVAEGLTSKQIGRQLFLSPKTVNFHLSSVFNKLGVDSRAQAAAVATRKGLL